MRLKSNKKHVVKPDEKRSFQFGPAVPHNEQLHFKTNFIRTSKYTLLTFLPKAIMVQFRRYANFFFLITAVIQCIKTVSPLNPVSAVAPFVFVIALSVVREGWEDYQRHKSDNELNSSPCEIYRNNQFSPYRWRDIRVGEIIRIKEGEFLAADVILLNTSNDDHVAFIETSSLDGEKNLKTKNTSKDLIDLTIRGTISDLCQGSITCDSPNPFLHRFEGFLELKTGKKLMLGPKNLLYRGSKLKNTQWALGVVVYTGLDTKVMRNAEVSYVKQSGIEKIINTGIIVLLLVMLLFCLLTAIGSYIWSALYLHSTDTHHINYLWKKYSIGVDAIINFFAYFLLLNTMIPISLIVTLEFVKLFQSFFVNKDVDMYNDENKRFARVSTTTIIEELGQVEYVFSDKTGTLTCNVMEFKLCMIGRKLYGDKSVLKFSAGPAPGELPALVPAMSKKVSTPPALLPTMSKKLSNSALVPSLSKKLSNPALVPNLSKKFSAIDYAFDEKELHADLRGALEIETDIQFHGGMTPIMTQKALINEFMKCLSLCHDCVVEKTEDGDYNFQVNQTCFISIASTKSL